MHTPSPPGLKPTLPRTPRRGSRGFSLIEIMVGLVIGLIAVLVIQRAFATFEAQKRSTSTGAEAQQNALVSLYTVERDVRQAGYGIPLNLLNCPTNIYNPVTSSAASFPMVPATITPNANANAIGTHTINIVYSTASTVSGSTNIVAAMPPASNVFKVVNPFVYVPGDFVMVYEPGKDCTILQVSSITPSNCQGSACNLLSNSTPQFPYNPPGGQNIFPPGGYSTGATITNLGTFANVTYSIDGATNRLIHTDNNTGTANEIADNIADLRAQYGYDLNNNNIIEPAEYLEPASVPVPPDWARVLSVRIAVMARSNLAERLDATAAYTCTTTLTAPSTAWLAAFTMRNDPSGTPWQCYRYRIYETIVPLRNIIWTK